MNKTYFLTASEKGHLIGLVDEGKYLRQSPLYKQILPRTPSWLKTSVISVAKNLFNLRNLRLIKELRSSNVLYNRRDTITDVMCALQIHLFLTNKANFQKSQMNVSQVITKYYENISKWTLGGNEPKRTQF